MASGPSTATEYRLRHKDGEWRWMLSLGRVVESDPQGRGLRLLGHAHRHHRAQARRSARAAAARRSSWCRPRRWSRSGASRAASHTTSTTCSSRSSGNAALALDELPADGPCAADLQEIQDAALRSAELTRQLLGFARKQAIEPRVLDLNDDGGRAC